MTNLSSRATTSSAPCRVCDSADTHDFFSLKSVPVQDGLLWATREAAIESPVGDIDLAFCRACGHVFNRSFDPTKLTFDPAYDISLFHSPMYARFCDETAAGLVERYGLRGKTALEVACGKGEFLQCLVRGGVGRAIGFDPTYVGSADADERISIVKDYYAQTYADRGGDLVCCRSALQYFTDPKSFLRMIRQAMGDRPERVVYFEVPNAFDIFRDLTIWNIVYEHGAFFSAASMSKLFTLAGFDVHRAEPCFEGQNLGIEASPSVKPAPISPDYASNIAAMARDVEQFVARRAEKVEFWRGELQSMLRAGERVVLWGAGARAISFCTTYDATTEQIPFVVDINPKRQGRFLPKTAQEVVAPEFLLTHQPDVVIATNSTFAPEIRRQVEALGIACGFQVL